MADQMKNGPGLWGPSNSGSHSQHEGDGDQSADDDLNQGHSIYYEDYSTEREHIRRQRYRRSRPSGRSSGLFSNISSDTVVTIILVLLYVVPMILILINIDAVLYGIASFVAAVLPILGVVLILILAVIIFILHHRGPRHRHWW